MKIFEYANFVTQLLGFKHERYAISSIPDFDARFLFVFLIAAVCLGLIGNITCQRTANLNGSSLSADRTAEKVGYAGKYKCQRCKPLWHFFTVICTLNNNVADYLGFKNNDRSTIVLSGISSAFGSVFGTPFAGAFFGMEVCSVGRLSAGAVIPCFACSYLANF